ncbi:unnamed protein product [Alternaria burnsii]|nr:unnamed protein product [Alternaria burnsii]
MNHPYHRVGEDYSFNPEPGERAGGLPNGFREAYQEHDIYRAGFAAHGAGHHNGEEYPENRSCPHPNFPVYLEDQQVERRGHVRHSVLNYIHESEVDTGNAASTHGRRQQRVESNGGGTQIDHPGMPSYSNNTREAAATPDNNPALDTVGNQAWVGERLQNQILLPTEHATAPDLMSSEVHFNTILANQGVSPGTEPYAEWPMDFPIDSNPGWYDDEAPAPRGQPEYNEEVPWSSVNLHNRHSRLPTEQLERVANMAEAYQTGHASHNSGDTFDLVVSNADPAGDRQEPHWSMINTATGHSTPLKSGNMSNPMGYASGPFDQEQGQDTPAVPSNQFVGQQDGRLQCYLLQTVIQGTAGQTPNHENVHAQSLTSDPSSSNPLSYADSTLSDPFRCPLCPSKFGGIHRQGNYGRHRRHKHRDLPRIICCEHPGCSKQFNRTDARRKHYRSHHPELLRGSE